MNIEHVEELYISYFNDFVSVVGFAQYYNMSVKKALIIIDVGRYYNHNKPRSVFK